MSQTRVRPSAGLSLCIPPVAAGGIDPVGGENFSGREVDHDDFFFIDEEENPFFGVRDSDAEVVHAAGPAERDFAVRGDVVVTDAGAPRAGLSGWPGFRGAAVRVSRGVSVE